MSERELELLQRIERLERHTWKNGALLRGVAMIAFTVMVGVVILSGALGKPGGSVAAPSWHTMWFYGLIAANAVSLFWTTHRE